MAAGISERVLLVTVDNYSKIIDPDNKTSFIIFSDGAAATILEKPETPRLFFLERTAAAANQLSVKIPGSDP